MNLIERAFIYLATKFNIHIIAAYCCPLLEVTKTAAVNSQNWRLPVLSKSCGAENNPHLLRGLSVTLRATSVFATVHCHIPNLILRWGELDFTLWCCNRTKPSHRSHVCTIQIALSTNVGVSGPPVLDVRIYCPCARGGASPGCKY